MAFIVTDSPFKALRGVQYHVEDCKEQYPLAAEELRRKLYVDDLLTGADSADSAFQLYRDCIELMDEASLPLRKWCSNSKPVLARIPEDFAR